MFELLLGRSGRIGAASMLAAGLGIAAPAYAADPSGDATVTTPGTADPTDDLTLTISPAVIGLDNPTDSTHSNPQQQIPLTVTATNAANQTVQPSRRHPIVLKIYQPFAGPLSPRVTNITSPTDPTVTLTYSGAYFQNSMLLTARLGHSSATAPIVRQNPLADCQIGSTSHSAPYDATAALANGFSLAVSVGDGPIRTVELDTGSTGLTISQSALGSSAIGPGQPFSRTYEPSGLMPQGNRWLARVKMYASSGGGTYQLLGQTVPIEVNAVSQVCTKAGTCGPGNFALMGIGFDRGSVPPSDNPFLQLTDIIKGITSPGYVFSSDLVSIGLDAGDTAGSFKTIPLQWDSSLGDWTTPQGCFSLSGSGKHQRQCGFMLLDTGIDGMIFATAEQNVTLAKGLDVTISAPSTRPSAMSYGFTWAGPTNKSSTDQPTFLDWAAAPTSTPPVFFNIGRSPLAQFDYFYDARCGRVGFLDHATQ